MKTRKDNGNMRPLTKEELQNMKGFENLTENEAEKELETINRIVKILYYLYMNDQEKK